MATITFENGTKVKFNGNPTPQDVEEVANKLGLNKSSTAPTPAPAPKKTFAQKAGGVLDSIFGGGTIGDAIGTGIAKNQAQQGQGVVEADYSKLSPEAIQRLQAKGVPTTATAQRQETANSIKGPSAGQVLGDVGRVALNFVPAGKAATGAGVGLKALGVGARAAKPIANIATGAGIGYAGDVTSKIASGSENPLTPGMGTGIGAGLSALPYVGRLAGKAANEVIGASTGVGGGTVKAFNQAIREGGDAATAARAGMRNPNAPEIVDEAKSAFGQFLKQRGDDYVKQLDTLKTKTNQIDHLPVIEKFNKKLEEFGVFFGPDGAPNFSRSPGLGRYKNDLMEMSKTLKEWGTQPGDNTIAGLDKLKQTIDDFRINSADSRKFDSFVTALRGETKKVIRDNLVNDPKTLATYDKMLGNFESATKEIRDIQKALSLGDKASTDTAFRKLSTVLRTNNEMRRSAIEQLNELTGGTLIPKIAGQQMSELAPRGIVKQLGLVGGGLGIASGVGLIPILKAAILTSPRIVGEILNALGIVGSKADLVKKALVQQAAQQSALIGAGQNDQ